MTLCIHLTLPCLCNMMCALTLPARDGFNFYWNSGLVSEKDLRVGKIRGGGTLQAGDSGLDQNQQSFWDRAGVSLARVCLGSVLGTAPGISLSNIGLN